VLSSAVSEEKQPTFSANAANAATRDASAIIAQNIERAKTTNADPNVGAPTKNDDPAYPATNYAENYED